MKTLTIVFDGKLIIGTKCSSSCEWFKAIVLFFFSFWSYLGELGYVRCLGFYLTKFYYSFSCKSTCSATGSILASYCLDFSSFAFVEASFYALDVGFVGGKDWYTVRLIISCSAAALFNASSASAAAFSSSVFAFILGKIADSVLLDVSPEFS